MGFKVVVGTPDGNKTVHEVDEWVNRVSVNTSRGEAVAVNIDKDQVELFIDFTLGDPTALGAVEANYGVEYFTEEAVKANEKNAKLEEGEDPIPVPIQEVPVEDKPAPAPKAAASSSSSSKSK